MTDAPTGTGSDASPDAERAAAVAAMYDRGEAVGEAAVEKALSKLSADGDDLDPETRAAIETLADRLVDGLLAPPAAGLAAGDEETIETALALFGADAERTDRRSTDSGSAESESDPAAARVGD